MVSMTISSWGVSPCVSAFAAPKRIASAAAGLSFKHPQYYLRIELLFTIHVSQVFLWKNTLNMWNY